MDKEVKRAIRILVEVLGFIAIIIAELVVVLQYKMSHPDIFINDFMVLYYIAIFTNVEVIYGVGLIIFHGIIGKHLNNDTDKDKEDKYRW